MSKPHSLILPPPEKLPDYYECELVYGLDPLEDAAITNWLLYGASSEYLISKDKTPEPGQNEFYSFSDRIQYAVFYIADELFANKIQKITDCSKFDLMTGTIYPTHVQQNITLQTIATRLKKFTVPNHIHYLSVDCVNQNSDLEELEFTSKLSGNYMRRSGSPLKSESCRFETPMEMLRTMPNLQKISFSGKPYYIQKLDYKGPRNNRMLIKFHNIMGLNWTFEVLNYKQDVVFCQIDKVGDNVPFKYENANLELSPKEEDELLCIRNRKPPHEIIVWKDSIFISNPSYVFKVLTDLNKPDSILFANNPDTDWQRQLIRAAALQTTDYDASLCSDGLESRGVGFANLDPAGPQKLYSYLAEKTIFAPQPTLAKLYDGNKSLLSELRENIAISDNALSKMAELAAPVNRQKYIQEFMANCK
ncbi:MAG: hypothetical protein LBR41_00465 [Rickettsiales bacterium]|jgi:hypothetical protein|nr:hypothetical protein [Rickettsiales bacterium]